MNQRLFRTIFVGVGVGVFVILMTIALALGIRQHQRETSWVSTTGTVTSVDAKRDDDGTVYRPRVNYSTPDGDYTCVNNTWTGTQPTVGEEREVLYDPDAPSTCSVSGAEWVPWMLGGMGTFFLVMFAGVGLAVTRNRASFADAPGSEPSDDPAELRGVSSTSTGTDFDDLMAENERMRQTQQQWDATRGKAPTWPGYDHPPTRPDDLR